MEIKTASLTADEARRASNAHFDTENQIMEYIRGMTLQGKRRLLDNIPGHIKAAESEAKG